MASQKARIFAGSLYRAVLTSLAILALNAAPSRAKLWDVTYNDSSKTFNIGGKNALPGDVVLTFNEGDLLILHVTGSIPGVITSAVTMLGFEGSSAPVPPGARVLAPLSTGALEGAKKAAADAYNATLAAIPGIQHAISVDLGSYDRAHQVFATALDHLLNTLELKGATRADPAAIMGALKKLGIEPEDEQFAANAIALGQATNLGPVGTSSFVLKSPGWLAITLTSTNALVRAPGSAARVLLREPEDGWGPSAVANVGSFFIDGDYSVFSAGLGFGVSNTFLSSVRGYRHEIGLYISPQVVGTETTTAASVSALIHWTFIRAFGVGIGLRFWESGKGLVEPKRTRTFFTLGYNVSNNGAQAGVAGGIGKGNDLVDVKKKADDEAKDAEKAANKAANKAK